MRIEDIPTPRTDALQSEVLWSGGRCGDVYQLCRTLERELYLKENHFIEVCHNQIAEIEVLKMKLRISRKP